MIDATVLQAVIRKKYAAVAVFVCCIVLGGKYVEAAVGNRQDIPTISLLQRDTLKRCLTSGCWT